MAKAAAGTASLTNISLQPMLLVHSTTAGSFAWERMIRKFTKYTTSCPKMIAN